MNAVRFTALFREQELDLEPQVPFRHMLDALEVKAPACLAEFSSHRECTSPLADDR